MTLKNYEKFKEESTCSFKIDTKLDTFWLENLKVSKIYTLMSCFWPKYILFELKTCDAKFEEKLNCGLENDMRNMANFHQSILKSQNWDNDGIL